MEFAGLDGFCLLVKMHLEGSAISGAIPSSLFFFTHNYPVWRHSFVEKDSTSKSLLSRGH